MAILDQSLQKTFSQQILGPRGGLFALGMFLGAACMYFFMSKTLIVELKSGYEVQLKTLNRRVDTLERENARIHERIETIALKQFE